MPDQADLQELEGNEIVQQVKSFARTSDKLRALEIFVRSQLIEDPQNVALLVVSKCVKDARDDADALERTIETLRHQIAQLG